MTEPRQTVLIQRRRRQTRHHDHIQSTLANAGASIEDVEQIVIRNHISPMDPDPVQRHCCIHGSGDRSTRLL